MLIHSLSIVKSVVKVVVVNIQKYKIQRPAIHMFHSISRRERADHVKESPLFVDTK